jgi:hypothetical protein
MDYTWKTYIVLGILILIILIIIYNIIQSLKNTETNYNWSYNTYNDNKYILLFIIILLISIIYSAGYISKKQLLTDTQSTLPAQQKSNFSNISNISTTEEQMTDTYKPPIITNPYNDLFISNTEKNQWRIAKSLLDGNEESLPNTNGTPEDSTQGYGRVPKNDILQAHSTLFVQGSNKVESANTSTVGDYATLDSLGKGLTDTLGGIHTELGYTVLEEQLGTFKKEEIHNPHTYDETANYNTGMSANTVDGNNGIMNLSAGNFGKCGNGQSVFIQKDFDGVANIFAPNIIIQKPPLASDGYPDISIRM